MPRVTVTVNRRTSNPDRAAEGRAGALHNGEDWSWKEAVDRATITALRRAGIRRCDGFQPDSGVPGLITALRSIPMSRGGGSSCEGVFWRKVR